MTTLFKVLTRRKVLDAETSEESSLARVLNTFDLTALGVGSTLGVGVYVLAGQVARNTAGPAVVISFLIAAIASVFAGLCYAEFGARTPKAGSAYIYSYVCVGEFVAFVIGWNLILEYIIGSASVAKGLSSYVDNLCNGTFSTIFQQLAPMDVPFLSPYFDFFAFGVPILLSIALAFGMKESSLLNNIFTTCNIGVVLFVIIAGAMNAHWSNWFINPADVTNVTNTTNLGRGGFFPFGIQGVIKGAATCFYGFVGFDCIATTGEEVKNPKRAIPIAIICSLLIIFLAYFGTSTVLTLMVPYYEQNPTAPIPAAFQAIHWDNAAYFVTFGAMFGLYASLFGAMFPLPRILYAMASDGLIFKFLGRISDRFKTPVVGTLLAGMFTGSMAGIFNLDSLVNMMSIGTLLAYTIVAACVLLLRYSVDEKGYQPIPGSVDSDTDGYTGDPQIRGPINSSERSALTDTTEETSPSVMKQIFNFGKIEFPNTVSQTIVAVDICVYCILCFLLGICALSLRHEIVDGEVIPLGLVAAILIGMALCMLSIASQPVSRTTLSFQVPLVPLIPALSILCNIYLMIMLDIATWIRFVVWMIIGVPIFFITRRCISDIDQPVRRITPTECHVNDGFYEDNIVYSNGTDPNQQTFVVTDEKTFPRLNLVKESKECVVQTPSPSRVMESLDFVIDSFADETASSHVMSASHALVSSTEPLDFRDTPNSTLRSELLNTLDKIDSKDLQEVSNQINVSIDILEPASIHENNELSNEKLTKVDFNSNIDNEETQESQMDDVSTSDSDASYISASSTIDTGQNNDLDIHESIGSTPLPSNPPLPPPPPPMVDLANFKMKVDSYLETNAQNNQPKKSPGSDAAKNQEYQFIVTSNSLNSLKLRHVYRPSLEGINSNKVQDSESKIQDNTKIEVNQPELLAIEDIQHLRPVKRPSLERGILSHGNVEIKETRNDPGRYKKSKSVNDYENKYVASKNDHSSNSLKKMDISKDTLKSVKLKPVVRPTLPMEQEPKDDLPDSLQFGSPQFKDFKGKLNEKLKTPVNILREPSFVDSKIASKKPVIKVSRENVIDENLDFNKARITMQNEVDNKLRILKAEEDSQSTTTEY